MPKKGGKKGGGGKLAAMTEEERLLFTQQKAVAEEEMSKRKEDMLTQFLKDKLRKEEHNSVVNQHKLTERWRAVFRQTRAQDLRKDIEILSQTFERVLDRKDSVIKCLLGDLTESKQQSDLVLRSYLQNVDLLLDLQGSRLAFHNQDMKTKLDELKAEFNTEREQIMALHKQDCIYLEDVRIGLDQRYAALDSEAQREYQSNRDDIKNRSIEDRNALRVQREGEVEEMWRQLQEATRSYRESTEEHRVACEALRERDERSSREIEAQMKRLQKIQESCAALRARMSTMQREGEAAARDLRAVKEKATDRRLELKKQMSSIHAQQRSALSRLTVLSDNANKKLQSVISKGERLIKLAGVCRKLETERERVQPFHSCSLSAEEQQLVKENQLEPAVTELAQAMHDYAGLEGMWQRWAKVELERLCLQREKVALSQENLRLRTLLRQYLDGLSVSDAALRQDHTLLHVSRSVHNQRQSQRQRPARQQQAAHVLQHTL
ncbi:dynein regulatory complex subunit 2-like [Conger conger]|uniref:dynein regulatory complex subunit 2-like n=1 Tax=Conger conger TaxID=82655 RepID=UPI002A5AC843|nr:dynein regulatory complex subunit 2-like [Conger conger]